MRVSFPTQNRSRRTFFRILPVPVFGSGSVSNCTIRGSLNRPSRVSKNAINSASVSVAPSLQTINAAGKFDGAIARVYAAQVIDLAQMVAQMAEQVEHEMARGERLAEDVFREGGVEIGAGQ